MDTELRFVCPDGHISIYEMGAKDATYDPEPCLECGKEAAYAGMEPRQLNMIGKVLYEQNGRLAYRIQDSKGNITHISKTKYDYMDSGGVVKHAFTKDYSRHLVEHGNTSHLEAQDLTKLKRINKAKVFKDLKDGGSGTEIKAPDRKYSKRA